MLICGLKLLFPSFPVPPAKGGTASRLSYLSSELGKPPPGCSFIYNKHENGVNLLILTKISIFLKGSVALQVRT